MNGRHRTSTAIALAIAAGLAGCAQAPTEMTDAELDVAAMGRSFEPEGARRWRPVRFVSCSWAAREVATAAIGAEGGTLHVADHEVRIPPGAVGELTTFVATVPEGRRVALTLEVLGRSEVDLARSAAVRISYARCGRQDLDRRTLSVVEVSTDGQLPLAAGASPIESTDDPVSDALEFAAARRGTYAVAY